nr:uncharacterized protein LOC123774621 [Procambarus clarkii]XP_045625071.1 uncharacterized protein LOC123774621 [Procambarus clarkii]
MDKIIQIFSKCKCCCSLRTLTFIHASIELIILAAAVVPVVLLSLFKSIYMEVVLMVALSLILVNFFLTCILIHGIRIKSQEIIGGWLWVRVATMVTASTTVVVNEFFNGSQGYYLELWVGLVLSLVVATYNVLVITAYARIIAAENKQASAQEVNIPNYGRLKEGAEP